MENKVIHSVICWDCSFRNFFNTIDGLLSQKFDRNQFELIYIEQRSKESADKFNHSLGLKSLWDRFVEVKDLFNIKVFYLNDPPKNAYHLGRTVNFGLNIAEGEIISVMDGDLLLPSDFLTKLEKYHNGSGKAIVNLVRLDAKQPVGVTKDNWTKAIIEYNACLEFCQKPIDPFPTVLSNKGPLISAIRKYWSEVDGYDEHVIWSTGLSRLGQDITARLELATNVQSKALPNCYAVHPWHPAGFHRSTLDSQKMLDIQMRLIEWGKLEREISWIPRTSYTNTLYDENKMFLDRMINSELMQPGSIKISSSDFKIKASIGINKLMRIVDKLVNNLRKSA